MRNLGSLGIIGAVGVAVLVLPFVGSDYATSFSIQLLIVLILAYSWNLIGGYTGYTHFGQVSFFGVGAYVGSLLIFHWGVPWYVAAAVAGLAGAAVAIPLGGAMLRLKGPFFAIGMFGLARVLEAFAQRSSAALLCGGRGGRDHGASDLAVGQLASRPQAARDP
jgi:branched-chain amino acid transport system permease protein